MTTPPPTGLSAAVLTASRALVGVSARSLAALDEDDVTLQQYRALVVLAGRGAQNVGSLAEALGIHPSTATRLCDRLLRKLLIERHASAESRREVTVGISPTGADVLRVITHRRTAEIDAIVARIPARQRALIVPALEAFAAAAGEVPDDAWRLGWQ